MYELTGIGSENFDSFSFLMPGHSYLDYDICIGAVEDGEAAGVALYNAVENALMLNYIYVAEKFRRRGIASAILNDFLEEIDDAGAVAVHINFPEFARDIYHFVVAQKFKIFRDGKAYVLPVEKLLNSARLNIAIIYLVNFSKDPFQLVDLMRVLTDRIKKKDYTDNDLVFVTMDDYMRKLPEKEEFKETQKKFLREADRMEQELKEWKAEHLDQENQI